MPLLDKLHHPERIIKAFLKWTLLALLVGILGGLLGASSITKGRQGTERIRSPISTIL